MTEKISQEQRDDDIHYLENLLQDVDVRIDYFDDADNFTKQFDDFLDETNEPAKICGIEFLPSDILKTDPVAYNSYLLDFVSWYNDDQVKDLMDLREEIQATLISIQDGEDYDPDCLEEYEERLDRI